MEAIDPLRTCKRCDLKAYTREDLELFAKNKGSIYGRAHECKTCYSTRKSKWAKDNPRKIRNKETIYQYGVTIEEYEQCMSTSDCCERCGKTDNLCYDHDHRYRGIEAFRGVLCSGCNRSIGLLGDTLEDLEEATAYLKRYANKSHRGKETEQSPQ